MLGVNQLDFINYCNALKGNYRKGVHKMETLLENPTHAKEFAKNLGGVSVVLGTPVGKEDRNSETLRSMLLASDVANDAVYTWMGQYYEFDSWDELLGDEDRCKAMMANELMWRALSASGVAMGKTVATLAGLSCSAYDDMSAVAASSTAMAAVASSQTAMTAVINNSTALNAVVSSSTAMAAVASSQTAMAAIITNSTALKAVVSSSAAMSAVAASQTAMTAIASSSTARAAIEKSQVAKDAIAASDMATAKYAVGAAGLKPADYANMAAVAASQTAMAAVASSQTAMAAVASSSTARTAITNSATAKNALASSPLKTTVTKGNRNDWENRTIRKGMGWLISCYNANSGGEAGSTWYKLDGVQTSQPAGTTNVGKFFTSSLAIYWWSSTSSVTYIPC